MKQPCVYILASHRHGTLYTTDETELVKLTFAGTPDMGFPLQREDRDIPAEIVRRVWNEGLRDYDTPYRSGDAVSDHWRQ